MLRTACYLACWLLLGLVVFGSLVVVRLVVVLLCVDVPCLMFRFPRHSLAGTQGVFWALRLFVGLVTASVAAWVIRAVSQAVVFPVASLAWALFWSPLVLLRISVLLRLESQRSHVRRWW